MNPILLAGTWAQYSRNATPHEKRMTTNNGQLDDIFISWSFRWPYHANVMNTFDAIRSSIVQIAFMSLMVFRACKSNIKFVITYIKCYFCMLVKFEFYDTY